MRLRDCGIYPLLRNYHKCETDSRCRLIAGNTISLLLRSEGAFFVIVPRIVIDLSVVDEIGAENLQKDVPVTTEEHNAEMHSTLAEVNEGKGNWVK